jgi:chromosome segregation ATPase
MFTLASLAFLIGPYSAPIWAAASAAITLYVTSRRESKKLNLSEKDTNRSQNRSDFSVIKEALYEEIERLKENQTETNVYLLQSQEDNKKCERQYFELSVQYKELLKYCAAISKQLKDLKQEIDASKEFNEQNRITNENSSTTKREPGSGSNA